MKFLSVYSQTPRKTLQNKIFLLEISIFNILLNTRNFKTILVLTWDLIPKYVVDVGEHHYYFKILNVKIP